MSDLQCIIMGAAGRDFHDFQRFFVRRPGFRVCCFTAEQIPFIEERSFPRELAGPDYGEDIPIFDEERLPELIQRFDVDFVFLAYSDLAHVDVMHRASLVQACGASFALLGPKHTQLESTLPVVSVTAVRTGAGKSPVSRAIAMHLHGAGRRVGVLRHPMPYGDLRRQAVQRFASVHDLVDQDCTVEELEEYEPYVEAGLVVHAGVDYARILAAAEEESDVILWDGGNNDTSFVKAGLSIVIVDALRAGHELLYYPGETNLRLADVVVVNKVDQAPAGAVDAVTANVAEYAPDAEVLLGDLEVALSSPDSVEGKRVLVIEDGPTLTHGGMRFGAGTVAAERFGAAEIIDPRERAVGSVAEAFDEYPHLGPVLPALGYSDTQRSELAETILACAPDLVIDASPANLTRVLELEIPLARVEYSFLQRAGRALPEIVDAWLAAT